MDLALPNHAYSNKQREVLAAHKYIPTNAYTVHEATALGRALRQMADVYKGESLREKGHLFNISSNEALIHSRVAQNTSEVLSTMNNCSSGDYLLYEDVARAAEVPPFVSSRQGLEIMVNAGEHWLKQLGGSRYKKKGGDVVDFSLERTRAYIRSMK